MTQKQPAIACPAIDAERSVDELRRQLGIVVGFDDGRHAAAFPVECLSESLFAALPTRRTLLITAARAKSLGYDTGDAKAMQLDASALTLPQIQALSDPLAGHAPAPAIAPASEPQGLLLSLTKMASLLPAMLLAEGDDILALFPGWHRVDIAPIRRYFAAPLAGIVETAQASLPLETAQNCTLTSYRLPYSSSVHLALVMGDISGQASPLTRIHSSCLTGDILGSLRCDCGDQLQMALAQIGAAGSGILLYLHQEGRGIGITNKLRAYQLQEKGFDTFEANLLLGFDEDERDFRIAAAILHQRGVPSIRMLTNNPHKIAALQEAGITVSERVPLIAQSGQHNHNYLAAKALKAGHLL
jgi:GTP cyclohydrolase II